MLVLDLVINSFEFNSTIQFAVLRFQVSYLSMNFGIRTFGLPVDNVWRLPNLPSHQLWSTPF